MTKQQSQKVNEVAKKQDETPEQVRTIAGDLDFVKTTVDGRLGEPVEEAVSNVKKSQAELGERQRTLKAELHDELLRKLSGTVYRTGLRPTAPLFIPAEGTTPETAAASGSSGGSTLSSHGQRPS